MAWFVVIATLLFLYGSFMMVRPSARQRQVSELRQAAINSGLEVRLASRMKLPEELSRLDMVCLISRRQEEDSGQSGSAFRNPETAKIRSYGVFANADEMLNKLFVELPQGVEALVSSEAYVAVCWDEKGDQASLEKIALCMDSLKALTLAR